jgi:hypothetical protein
MQVYSTPMTPPPTTISVLGSLGRSRTWSLLMMVRPLMGTLGESGLGAGGDENVLGIVDVGAARVGHRTWFGIFEAAPRREHLDVVARELGLGDVDLGLDDVLDAEGEVGHGDRSFTR